MAFQSNHLVNVWNKWVALYIIISSYKNSGNNFPGWFNPMIVLESLRLIQTLIETLFGSLEPRNDDMGVLRVLFAWRTSMWDLPYQLNIPNK